MGALLRGMMAGVVGGGGDPYWSNVVSLLHFDGADASTTFTDEKGKTWAVTNNAQIDTAQSKFGGASALFDGAEDMISHASHADFGFGTGDFTVECWARRVNHTCVVWDSRTAGGEAMVAFFDAAGNICFFDTTTKTGSIAVAANTWAHVAWCRGSGTMRMFVNGVQAYSGALAKNMGAARPFRIAMDIVNGADYSGHLDEFRVTKGVARYTANFTPPTAAFPNS